MHPALDYCANCDDRHPLAAHYPADPRSCRVNGCGCEEFIGATAAPESEVPRPNPLDARTLLVVIPEGFTATVELIPIPMDSPVETRPQGYVIPEGVVEEMLRR